MYKIELEILFLLSLSIVINILPHYYVHPLHTPSFIQLLHITESSYRIWMYKYSSFFIPKINTQKGLLLKVRLYKRFSQF